MPRREPRLSKTSTKPLTLKGLRERAGFKSQLAAAVEAELDQTTIGGLENGESPDPRISTIDSLVRAYGSTRDEVIAAIAQSVKEAVA